MLENNETRKTSIPCPWCKSKDATVEGGKYICPRCGYEQDVSNPPKIKVIGWTNDRDNDYPSIDCKTDEIYDAIVKAVREGGYSFGWGEHQSENFPCTPVINNGCKISCGTRAWSAIMSEANYGDNSHEYLYSIGLVDNPKYPKAQVNREEIIPFEIEE